MKNLHVPNIHSCRQNALSPPKDPKVLPLHSIYSIASSKSSTVQVQADEAPQM